MAVETKHGTAVKTAMDQQMELLSLSYVEKDREGAGEQNGTTDAKKQSSSSQTDEVFPEQRRLMGHSSSGNLFPPHGGMKKSSSGSSVGSIGQKQQQSHPARKPTADRFDEVRERRLQLEEQRRAALEKQINEKEKRRQRAQEIKKKMPFVRSQPGKPFGKQASTPTIVVEPVAVEQLKSGKTKPPPLDLSTENASSGPSRGSPRSPVSSMRPKSPTSPRSPRSPVSNMRPKSPTSPRSPRSPVSNMRPKSPTSPKSPRSPAVPKSPTTPKTPLTPKAPKSPADFKTGPTTVPQKKVSPTKRKSPPSGKIRRLSPPVKRPSPPGRKFSPPGKKVSPMFKKPTKQVMSMVRKEIAEKKQRLSLTPPIVEVIEPIESPEATAPQSSGSSSHLSESCSSLSIYYRPKPRNKPKRDDSFLTSSDTDEPSTEQQQRRLTLQERQRLHDEERKSSHPNMKFHPVEFCSEPREPYKPITTREHEKRKNKKGAPKMSAVANMMSMRPDGKDCAEPPHKPTSSAPASCIVTPSASPRNSPKRNQSVAVMSTPEHKPSPLVHQASTDTMASSMATVDEEVTSQVSVIADIKAPAPQQMGTRRRTMSGSSLGSDKDFEKIRKIMSRGEICSDDEDTDASDFPPSNFELRPQEACLYAIYNSGSTSESEMFLMGLNDEQILQIEIISTLPQAMEQLVYILPVVQQYLDKGATAFKALSAVDSDDSRNCYIIYPTISPSSSASNRSSLSSIEF